MIHPDINKTCRGMYEVHLVSENDTRGTAHRENWNYL